MVQLNSFQLITYGISQKPKTQATLPLGEEALSYFGEPSRGLVFKGLSRAHTREPFKNWLNAAGITQKN